MSRGIFYQYIQEPISRATLELPWFGPVFSAVFVAMAVNVVTDTLTAMGNVRLAWLVVLALLAGLVVFANAYSWRERQRRAEGMAPLDRPNPRKHRGLVFIFSREDTLREAVRHHEPILEHCWLIVTPEMQAKAAEAIGHFPHVQFTVRAIPDRYNTRACYDVVWDIYRSDAPRLDIPAESVISDITGGTKPMSTGVFMACCEGGFHVEHVPSAFDANGRPTGPLPPIEIVLPAKVSALPAIERAA